MTPSRVLSEIARRMWALTLGVVCILALGAADGHPMTDVLAGPLPALVDCIVPISLVLLAAASHPLHPRWWTALLTLGACLAWWFGAVLIFAAGC